MRKENFYTSNGKIRHKNDEIKEHACLTSFEGILDVINAKIEYRDNTTSDELSESEKHNNFYDLYSYDYLCLNVLAGFVDILGYDAE